MKRIILSLLIIIGATLPGSAQEEIYEVVEVQAEFPGGMSEFRQFLANNIKYPDTQLEMGISGKCHARFVVHADGRISDPKIIMGIVDCPECDAEVLRVINIMPVWTPAMINGKPVASYYYLPVTFHADVESGKTKKEMRKEMRKRHRAIRKNGDF